MKEYEIQIEIENQCYLDCIHCSSFLLRNASNVDFLDDELSGFFQLFEGPLHVYFTGGEPLVNQNLLSYIKLVKAINSQNKTGIFTCGILEGYTPIDKEYAKTLRRKGLDDCYVSLYHFDPEKHDTITNHPGSFNITYQSIRNLIESGVEVKSHLVINRLNYQELDRIINYIFDLGITHVRLLRIVKTGAAEHNWREVGMAYAEQNILVQNLIKQVGNFPGGLSFSGFPREIACRPAPNALKCQAGTNLLYITKDKMVFPCACTKGEKDFKVAHITNLDIIKNYLREKQNLLCNDDCLNPIS